MRDLAAIDAEIAALKLERLAVIRAAWDGPGSLTGIAASLGMPVPTLKWLASKEGWPEREHVGRSNAWTPGRIAALREGWLAKVPRSELAQRFGTSEGRISQIIDACGLPRRQPGRRYDLAHRASQNGEAVTA